MPIVITRSQERCCSHTAVHTARWEICEARGGLCEASVAWRAAAVVKALIWPAARWRRPRANPAFLFLFVVHHIRRGAFTNHHIPGRGPVLARCSSRGSSSHWNQTKDKARYSTPPVEVFDLGTKGTCVVENSWGSSSR